MSTGLRRRIPQFNRILQRQIGVRDDFVDHHRGQREIVRILRRRCRGKRDDRRPAVRQTPLRDVRDLRAERDRIDLRAVVGGEQEDRIPLLAELEVHVLRAGGHGGLSASKRTNALEPTPMKDRSGIRYELGAPNVSVNLQATERHRSRVAVVEFKPVIARGRIGHPFVHAQQRGVSSTATTLVAPGVGSVSTRFVPPAGTRPTARSGTWMP
ncbi:MAG: hypothetical protein IPK15_10480 [Verrucomicrobia bacterium]|nr:hypothetical protein [Verrucomicrobiota bacterium]